uniref:Cellulase 5B n=1 Tax=Anoplophora chinensis TaxID=217632 RepID=K4GMM5_ANOCN|nr:cellulase 5B [Anoplophora chinensis]
MNKSILSICLVVLALYIDSSISKDAGQETVSKHGKLSVKGANIVNQNGEIVQLKGMCLYWSIWKPQYWNEETVQGIHDSCHSNVIRASMGVETNDGGYLTDPDGQMKLVETVIEAAIKHDLYIIVDWHEEKAGTHQTQAVDFFDKISKKYGSYPNLMYETFNEPTTQSWSSVLKPYHEAVIKAIRANDPDNIIICGTGQWSQRVDEAADDPITSYSNIMYTLHFYAGTHKQWLRDLTQGAIDKGLPIFVTEYGTDNVDVVNWVDPEESQLWWDFCDKNNLSYTNWAICDVAEASAALIADTPPNKVCQQDYLTESGLLVVAQNKK